MQLRDLKRIIKDYEAKARRSVVDNKKWEYKWRAKGRVLAYRNVLEYLEIIEEDASR